jgi:hypothetical protein
MKFNRAKILLLILSFHDFMISYTTCVSTVTLNFNDIALENENFKYSVLETRSDISFNFYNYNK